MPGTVRWIFVPEVIPRASDTTSESDNDPDRHGTCVLAMAVSQKFGVAKKANVVIVKLPADAKASSYYESVQLIENDIVTRRLQGKAVVNYSNGCK
jgi:hypothetical protein